MKILFFLLSLTALSACNTLENSVYHPMYFGPNNMTIDQAKSIVIDKARGIHDANSGVNADTICKSIGIYDNPSQKMNYPLNECRRDATIEIKSRLKEISKKQQEKAREQEYAEARARLEEENERAKKEAIEAEKKKEAERVASENLKKSLKSGEKKPSNLYEASILYDAKEGYQLASSPKIKPDNDIYVIRGVIEIIEDENRFIARIALSKAYFEVNVSESIKQEFIKNARVNGGFGIIGKYTENTKIQLVNGRISDIPSFEAIYFKEE